MRLGRQAALAAALLLAVGAIGLLVVLATAALPGVVVAFVGGAAYSSLVPLAWIFAAIGATFALAQALLLTRLAIDDRRAVIAVWGAAALLVALATLVMPRSVGGLATSALVAGLALAAVGVAVTARELRGDTSRGPATR